MIKFIDIVGKENGIIHSIQIAHISQMFDDDAGNCMISLIAEPFYLVGKESRSVIMEIIKETLNAN